MQAFDILNIHSFSINSEIRDTGIDHSLLVHFLLKGCLNYFLSLCAGQDMNCGVAGSPVI
jgi:hypothetical protein